MDRRTKADKATDTEVAQRYGSISEQKSTGSTYTPRELADFVAAEMLRDWLVPTGRPLRILDPAVGAGELLASILRCLPVGTPVSVYAYDSNRQALEEAGIRIRECNGSAEVHLLHGSFLDSVGMSGSTSQGSLFAPPAQAFDLVIANPPYVRTQILGADAVRSITEQFGLKGRVDLYHAFVLAIAQVLSPNGRLGIIVSNRFMTTRAGATVRKAFLENLHMKRIWDLGDTKMFDAAVLPAVIIAEGRHGTATPVPSFTSVYEVRGQADEAKPVATVCLALSADGVVSVPDGRRFKVIRGVLDTSNSHDGVWRVATIENDAWLATVQSHTWARFGDLGKIRVGVKTCADAVFIRADWESLPSGERPELLRVLTTHHIGHRYRASYSDAPRQIVYPHESVGGKRRAVNLASYPATERYLKQYKSELEARAYLMEAGRSWFELWVPQDPSAWSRPKLVFRDISEAPCFWIDNDGTVVNGDCYWLVCDDPAREHLLWLAACVGNSTFIEHYYDHRFNNKLYAGRRRYITQYVEKFPIPDPLAQASIAAVSKARAIYDSTDTDQRKALEQDIDELIWVAFGLRAEEVRR